MPSAVLWDSPGIQLKNVQALRLLAGHLTIDRDRGGNAGVLSGEAMTMAFIDSAEHPRRSVPADRALDRFHPTAPRHTQTVQLLRNSVGQDKGGDVAGGGGALGRGHAGTASLQ